MQAPQLTPEDLKVARDVLIAFGGFLVTAVGFLIRTAYKMGKDAAKVALALESLTVIKLAVEKVPVLEARLETAEEVWRQTRSDIKHLLRGSRPDIQPNGNVED